MLDQIIPDLILGSAPFFQQFNADPLKLPVREIVKQALQRGVRGFDTSPYYGPAEMLLDDALAQPDVKEKWPRETYFLSTKCGRIEADVFDYSPEWIHTSLYRSLDRLQIDYIDLLIIHDVEIVSEEEVLGAVNATLDLIAEGKARYVGISGYPTELLAHLARQVKEKFDRPLDAILSYAHQTLHNATLIHKTVPKFVEAGVKTVINGAPLAMGLLRAEGVPIGSLGDFHPAPAGLREASRAANEWSLVQGEKLSYLATRYAASRWRDVTSIRGVTAVGVSSLSKSDENLAVYENLGLIGEGGNTETREEREYYETLFNGVREQLREWVDYEWKCPFEGYIRKWPENEPKR